MRRRDFVLLLGGAIAAPRALRAQQKSMPVIGFLGSGSPGTNAAIVAAFHQGLSETGYVEGQNVAIEYRWADDDAARLPALAADLVRANVEVIVTSGGPQPASAAMRATAAISIVASSAGGLVEHFNRPEGNLTGLSFLTGTLTPKRLELSGRARASRYHRGASEPRLFPI
jgi:putative ABC transport system substrate-binding protein